MSAPSTSSASASTASAEAAQRLDLRLLPIVLGAWCGALAGRSSLHLLPAALLALVGAALTLRVRLAGTARRGLQLAAATACIGVAGGLLSAGVRAASRQDGPLHQLAGQRTTVSVIVTLTGDPLRRTGRVVGSARRDDTAVTTARLTRVTPPARRPLAVRQPVLLLTPAQGWVGLLPSQQVELEARVLAARSSDTVAAVLVARGPPQHVSAPSALQRLAARLRGGLRASAQVMPSDEAALLPGLVDGDDSAMSPELTDAFRASGLTHLTAVSGSNCAVVLGMVLVLARRTRLGMRGRAALGGIALVGFVVLARPSPSVLRAAVMGAVTLLALASGRPRSALPALLGAILVLLLGAPDLAMSAGFALSALATAGLLVLAPPLGERLRAALPARCPGWVSEALAVPLAAQLMCAPVIAGISGTTSLAAVPANLLAIPAVPPATILGVLTMGAAQLSPTLGRAAALVTEPFCWWLVRVARMGAGLPGARLPWPDGTRGAVLLAVALLIVVPLAFRRRSRRLMLALLAGLLVAHVCLVPVTVRQWPPADWTLVACDVGQGDALLVRTGPADAVLVDAGPDPAPLRRCLASAGVRRLPAVVLTHMHADHVDGLLGAVGRLPVGEVVVGPLREPPSQWRQVVKQVNARGLPMRTAAPGERWTVGTTRFEVLGPRTVLHGTNSDPNNDSIVLLVAAGGLRLLLTGDVEPEAQRLLLAGEPAVDVLKVPHHGSAHQEPAFLRDAHAGVALVSVGTGNPYGHPSQTTLRELHDDGTSTWRTDQDGSVAVERRGGRIEVVASRTG